MDLGKYKTALEIIKQIKNLTIEDRIVLIKIQSALKDHSIAVYASRSLLSEYPDNYNVCICYVSTLILSGSDKDAIKFVRTRLKDKTADSNAIAAYAMRIMGNIKIAYGYATRAVQLNNNHIGAMETLGICLASLGEYKKARIVACAINNISPGNKAAINILSSCKDQK